MIKDDKIIFIRLKKDYDNMFNRMYVELCDICYNLHPGRTS